MNPFTKVNYVDADGRESLQPFWRLCGLRLTLTMMLSDLCMPIWKVLKRFNPKLATKFDNFIHSI